MGYKSVRHTFAGERNGKERSYCVLKFDEDSIDLGLPVRVKSFLSLMYCSTAFMLCSSLYLENISFTWDKSNVKRILINPCNCIADRDSYDYFERLGCEIYFTPESCSYNKGILAYNRHAGRSKKISPPEKWIIAKSGHQGLFSGKEWVRIQHLIEENGKNCYGGVPKTKQSFNKRSILSGLLRCANCGDYMRPKMANGKMYYMCVTKEKSKKQKCAMCNIDGDLLDKLVLGELFRYNVKGSAVNSQLSELRRKINSVEDDIANQIKSLSNKKKNNEKAIQNLLKAISNGASELTITYINRSQN